MASDAIWGQALSWCKTVYQHSSVFTANSGFQLLFKHGTIPCNIDHLPMILVVVEDRPFEVPNSVNIILAAEGTLLNFLVLGTDMFPPSPCFDICLQVRSGTPMFFCDNLLQENLSFLILLQKLHVLFLTCLFVLICKLLWHWPCTHFVIPEVLVDDGICVSTADVQLIDCISDSNLSVVLNQSINLFNILCHLWNCWSSRAVFINDAWSATLEPFHPLVHLPLHS